jgi:endonuclease I
MKHLFTLCTFVFTVFALPAQPPPGYYNPAIGLTGVPLKQALHNIIDNHTSVSYSSLLTHFQTTDDKPNGKVWDIYSDVPSGTPPYEYTFGNSCGNYSGEGDCYNREHSWPQSWFNSASPMQSDMFHIYPTDGYVNGMRGNYPFSEVSNPTWTAMNGGKLGPSSFPGYTGTAFEPIDEYKGDLARSYFYMSVRYYTEDAAWSSSAMVTKAELNQWAVNLLLQWSNDDPVSQKETDRNNDIYGIQNNRNPFIDHPEYAPAIWTTTTSGTEESAALLCNVYPNPSATGEFMLSVPTDASVVIYTITGSELKRIDAKKGEISISLEMQPAGIYLLRVLAGTGSYNRMIVKSGE